MTFCPILRFFIIYTFCFWSCKKHSEYTNKSIFRYNEHTNINSLDPAYANSQNNIWGVHQIFNGLVRLDDSLYVVSDIAKKWEISKNAKLYTFTLRKDVLFHKHLLFGKDSTRAVSAFDFEYSFNRLSDEKIASPGRWVLNYIADFKAKNDSIFNIKLKHPFPGFLGLLANKYYAVVPKEITEYYGSAFSKNPIGTGPFYFKVWQDNIKMVLLKNPNYHRKDSTGKLLPYLDAINISFLPDKQSEFLEFIKGEIDMINSIDVSYKDELLTFDGKLNNKYSKNIRLLSTPYLNTEYIGLYMESNNDALNSVYIRKALNYGFDRNKVITYLRNGLAAPALQGMIPNSMPGSNSTSFFEYNPQKAKELVNKYITQNGNYRPKITLNTDANYLDICEYLQNEYEKIGILISINLMTSATLKQSKANGKINSFRASWIADYPDAENYMSLFYSKNFAPNGPNYTHFSNRLFDQLYEQSFKELDTNKRYELYKKMDSIVCSYAPVIPLYYDKAIRFISNKIENMNCNPINLLDLEKVIKK